MEPGEFAALEQLARARHSSVADLMREAARKQYLNPIDRERRAAAAKRFVELPQHPLPDWAEVKEELENRRGSDLP